MKEFSFVSTSSAFTHLFSVVDRFTRWPEAIPLTEQIPNMADAFLRRCITRYVLPSDIYSGLVSQFTSLLHSNTAYHPQAIGLVERFYCSMKVSLRALYQSPSWKSKLHWVMQGLKTMLKDNQGTSPAPLVFGSRSLSWEFHEY